MMLKTEHAELSFDSIVYGTDEVQDHDAWHDSLAVVLSDQDLDTFLHHTAPLDEREFVQRYTQAMRIEG